MACGGFTPLDEEIDHGKTTDQKSDCGGAVRKNRPVQNGCRATAGRVDGTGLSRGGPGLHAAGPLQIQTHPARGRASLQPAQTLLPTDCGARHPQSGPAQESARGHGAAARPVGDPGPCRGSGTQGIGSVPVDAKGNRQRKQPRRTTNPLLRTRPVTSCLPALTASAPSWPITRAADKWHSAPSVAAA